MRVPRDEWNHDTACGIGSATNISVYGVRNTSVDQTIEFRLDDVATTSFTRPRHAAGTGSILSDIIFYNTSLPNTQSVSHTLVIQDIQGDMLFQSLVYV